MGEPSGRRMRIFAEIKRPRGRFLQAGPLEPVKKSRATDAIRDGSGANLQENTTIRTGHTAIKKDWRE